MVIEWATISGVVLPALKKYASERAKKLESQCVDEGLSKLYQEIVGEKVLSAANNLFLARFNEELDRVVDLPTLNTSLYREALQKFLSNPSVQDIIQAPLDGESDLDWKLLDSIWKEITTKQRTQIAPLPVEFDWPSLARMYKKGIQRQLLSNPKLRPVMQAIMDIRIAEASQRTASAIERLAGPNRVLDLNRYADAINAAFGYLRLGTIDTDWTHYEGAIRLEKVYIPQSVKRALPPPELTRDYMRQLRQEGRDHGLPVDDAGFSTAKRQYSAVTAQAVMDVIDDNQHRLMVLLGDPGLGKSTLLKHLALRWVDDRKRPITLFAELRQVYRPSGFAGIFDFFERAPTSLCPLPRAPLHEYLRQNDSVVLFDGLDELPEGQRAIALGDILSFSGDYRRARIIITTRIQGYFPGSTYPEQLRHAGFDHFTLQDFQESEIDSFILAWHKEAFRNLQERSRYQARLKAAIADSPAIRELAANPLMLTMMSILNRTQDLPRDRSKLYERCAELLLINWDLEKFPERKERSEARDIKDKLGSDQKMRILERVAAQMQKERTGLAGNLIAEDNLKQIVQEELNQLGIREPWAVAGDLIWMLRERNFMISYVGDHQFAFVHRTFLEFFCARDIRYRLEKTLDLSIEQLRKLFRECYSRDEWKEVLRLLCGMIGPIYAEQCIGELIAIETGDPDNVLLLASECLQEIREIGLVKHVRSKVRQMLLAALPDSQRVLRTIATLARTWRDDSEVLAAIKERVNTEKTLEIQRQLVSELAAKSRGDRGVLALLTDIGCNSPRALIRYDVVKAVAKTWKSDPSVRSFLNQRAISDADPDVRYVASHPPEQAQPSV